MIFRNLMDDFRMNYKFLPLISLAFIAACASTGPGKVEDSTPPRLVKDSSGVTVWDRPAAFGPVAGDKLALGVAACGGANAAVKPAGYHSRAMDEKGVAFPSGGFMCMAK